MATLHKELSSPSTPRKVIKPVQSPSPVRRAAAASATATEVRVAPPFKASAAYQSRVETRELRLEAEEEFEDWEPPVGFRPSPPPPAAVRSFSGNVSKMAVALYSSAVRVAVCLHAATFFSRVTNESKRGRHL